MTCRPHRLVATKRFLTLAIPTYNRAHFVCELLENLSKQIVEDGLQEDIVIQVRNNASSDDTQSKVEAFVKSHPKIDIRYACNPTNVGWPGNFALLVSHSDTPWTWMLGDDDEVTAGSLRFVVDRLRTLPADISFATILTKWYDRDLKQPVMDYGQEYASDRIWQGVDAESAHFYFIYQFIGQHIFKTEKWSQMVGMESYKRSELIQMYFIFYWIARGEKIAFFNRLCIRARVNNTPNENMMFDISWAILHERSTMIESLFAAKREQRLLLKAFFHPFDILSFRKAERGWGPSERSLKLFREAMRHYAFYWRFWLLYPWQAVMPPPLVRQFKKILDSYRVMKNQRPKSSP